MCLGKDKKKFLWEGALQTDDIFDGLCSYLACLEMCDDRNKMHLGLQIHRQRCTESGYINMCRSTYHSHVN